MGIALTEDQRALESALSQWAADTGTTAVVRDSEEQGAKVFEPVWAGLADVGVQGIAVPEPVGAGGSLLDLAVAVETCAAALVPGPLLPTVVAATALPADHHLLAAIADGSASVALGMGATSLQTGAGRLQGTAELVWGAGTTTHVLLPTVGRSWALLPVGDGTAVEIAPAFDLSTRVGSVDVDVPVPDLLDLDERLLRLVAAALAAAEASGIAHWCLDTAVEYAKVREQFGRRIGSFQAVKHLCAEMLEAAEATTALAWDAASAHGDGGDQFALATATAASVALDAAVRTAQDAVQVLGGIGFTWEHDVHLYLRRAMVNRQMLGGSDSWRLALADLAISGVRRSPHVELGDEGDQVRAEVRRLVRQVAEAPVDRRRVALAETGLLTPHWPTPYGRGASPVEQLVIEEELRDAGVERPDIGIAAWAAPTILEHGDDTQRERFLAPTLRGDVTWCQLFSEPGAGSDLASLRTKAQRSEGGWLLSGQKVWTSLAADADWGICLARTNPDAPRHRGITYFLVDMASQGIEIRALRELTGEALFNEVFLDQVFVSDDCVVGQVDGGWPLARTTLANERVAIGGSSLGSSVERAVRRVASTPEPGELLRVRVGTAVAAAGTVKALGLRSTRKALSGHGPGAESSVLKLVGVRERQDSAELALDLLREDALLGRDEGPAAAHEALVTRCLSIAGGTTQVLRDVVAERLLGLPRS